MPPTAVAEEPIDRRLAVGPNWGGRGGARHGRSGHKVHWWNIAYCDGDCVIAINYPGGGTHEFAQGTIDEEKFANVLQQAS